MSRVRVLILAGGQSEEHEVSISSARSLLAAVADSDIDASVLVISKDGRWLSSADSGKALLVGTAKSAGELTLHRAKVTEEYDVVFPLLHGPHGEDGTIQGMLELAGLAYVGSGVLASAVCMDKGASKDLMRAHNIPQTSSLLTTRHEFGTNPGPFITACQELRPPWFVKPANLGSSVGISKATTTSELRTAIAEALRFDRRAIVEEGVVDARELEVGILGNDEPEASPVGEITYDADFYDYETKYTDGRAQLHIPADIPKQVAERIRDLAIKAYRIHDCVGFARVDFFYQQRTDNLLLNEVNTIPGFTPYSMFTKLWQHAGLSYADVVRRLIDLALERHGKSSITRNFS